MKKSAVAVCLYLTVSLFAWGQSFELPKVTNTVESVEEAVRAFIEQAARLGNPESKSDWGYSEESMVNDFKAYLDSIFKNMTYDNIKNYVTLIRINIDAIDVLALSRSQQEDFKHFLEHVPAFWVSNAMEYYRDHSFPPSLVLQYDTTPITKFDNQMKEYEIRLDEYRKRLAGMPTLDEIRVRINANRAEQEKPEVKRDRQHLQTLKNEEYNLGMELSNLYTNRDNLTRAIRELEKILENTETTRIRFIESVEKPEREKYISEVSSAVVNFYTWVSFFDGENTFPRDFLTLQDAKQDLYEMLDVIPQRQEAVYRAKLDALCAGWGI
jgi:hypothetical protein